jgi:hypothetical protein
MANRIKPRYLAPLVLLLLACRTLFPAGSPVINLPAPTPRQANETATPEAALTAQPAADEFSLRLHPDGPLYVGDQVSLEVIPPAGANLENQRVAVQVEGGADLGAEEFEPYGIGGRLQATFLWAWDTSGLDPGEYTLDFSLEPGETTWTETVSLLPANLVPPPEPGAHWETAETDCCLVYYITGTEAERDLATVLEMVDWHASRVSEQLQAETDEPAEITFLPRVLGHGGFASGEISVSYLDRNYAGSTPEFVLHHELVHLFDARLGGDLRPTLLVEGLAVYLTGGHFKPEPLMGRAAALLAPTAGCQPAGAADRPETSQTAPACGLNRYLPLIPLIDNFYQSQHEIGYLQAGALIEYMVETWGWQAFSDFYRDIHPAPEETPASEGPPLAGGPQAQAVDLALREHFGLTLAELEARFITALGQEPLTPALVEDVRLTVAYYDTVRRYQQILDPSAYFLYAWLPDPEKMREKRIVADYLRRPWQPENQALETLLAAADQALRSGELERTRDLLEAINASLDVFTQRQPAPHGD